MTIPHESARKRALQLISDLELYTDVSPSPEPSLPSRLGESHSAVRSVIRVLSGLAEDIGEECRERGELLWKLADILQSKADAQILAAAMELRDERQATAAEHERVYKELVAEKAKSDELVGELGRSKVTEAALRGREAELIDEVEWLKVNNKVMAHRLKEHSTRTGHDVGVGTDIWVGVDREDGRCPASREALLEALANPEVIEALAPALPERLANTLRAVAANVSLEDGRLNFTKEVMDDAWPVLVERHGNSHCPMEEGVQTEFCGNVDTKSQTDDQLTDCTSTQTDEPLMIDELVETELATELLLPSPTGSTGVVSASSSPEVSSCTADCARQAAASGGGAEPAEDLEVDELLKSDFVHLIDLTLLQGSPRGPLDAARRSPREAALLGHTDLHALINRLYDSLTGQFNVAEGRAVSESVGWNVMAFLRRQHGVPSVLAERSWQLVQSLLRWQGPEAAPRSLPGSSGTRCCTCSTVVQFLSGRRTFVDFRMMLYFRELLRRRSKYRHNYQGQGSSKAAATIKIGEELFTGAVSDSVTTAVRAADAWKAQWAKSVSPGLVADEFTAKLIEALLDGWTRELEGLAGPHMNGVQEAAVAYVDADANFTGRLTHVDCLAAAGGGRGMGWTFERDDGPSHVGLADFAKEVGSRRATVGVSELDAEIEGMIDDALSALELDDFVRSLVHSGNPGEEYAGRQYQSRIGILRRLLFNGDDAGAAAAIEGISLLAYFIFNECRRVRTSTAFAGPQGKLVGEVLRSLIESAKAFKFFVADQQMVPNPAPGPPVRAGADAPRSIYRS